MTWDLKRASIPKSFIIVFCPKLPSQKGRLSIFLDPCSSCKPFLVYGGRTRMRVRHNECSKKQYAHCKLVTYDSINNLGSSNLVLSFGKSLSYKYSSGPVFSSYNHIQMALKLSRIMIFVAFLVVYTAHAFLLVNGNYAAIVRCPNCGTTPVPYPLSTGPKCGQRSYKIECDGNVLKFNTLNNTYPIISISLIDQRIVIQRSNVSHSTCVTSNLTTHDIQLNTSLRLFIFAFKNRFRCIQIHETSEVLYEK